ncbi:MAG: HEAT repeat domain-containing protein [Gloeotrichia echinulata HAB0833]
MQVEDLLQQCTVKLSISGQLGWGTGFFVAPGLILTCAYVVKALAAHSRVRVRWQQQVNFAEADLVHRVPDLDLALLQFTPGEADLPCVYLDEGLQAGQDLYFFGYPDVDFEHGCPVTGSCEGLTGDVSPLIKFKQAQVRPGMSGSALLNRHTRKVCGMVKFTRTLDRSSDLGSGAIPTRVILEQFPELRSLQQAFHGCDKRWVNLINKQPAIDFQPYLESIATTYEKWWRYYTLTDAESKQRQVQESAPMFDFGLMVQTVQKQEREQPQQEKPAQEKVERFSVLDGLRKYALGKKPEPVLLVGRPGSGKSTTLAKLLLEEASTQKSEFLENSNFSASIPVLVELRYWQGSLSDLIHNAIARHDPTLKAVSLDRLLTNALLLFDGVNELPSEEARSQLAAFRHNHPNLPMIFTTRDLSLGGDLGIERKLEILPLTEPQMQAFIRAYIPGQAEAMLRQLKDRLREFGQTPLLLWMLCEVFQQAPNNQLPSNLGGVFQAFTRMYEESSVRKHDVALLKGDVRPLSDRRLWKKALMAIAAIMMQGKTPVDFRVAIHRDEVEKELSRVFPNERFPVRDILDDLLKYHLLQNQTTDRIEFRHQLIQEYYAAEYLLRLLQPPDGKPGLTDDQLKRDYLNYLKWTEPVALMLAFLEDEAQAVRVVKLSLDVDSRLGARLAGEVKPAFQSQTVNFVKDLEVPDWLKVQLLGETRSDYAIPTWVNLAEGCSWETRKEIAELLSHIRSNAAMKALLKLLEDSHPYVRGSATKALGEIGSDEAIAGLLKLLTKADFGIRANQYVRESAVDALGEIGSELAVSSLLKLIDYSDSSVRRSAAKALGKIGTENFTSALLKLLDDSDSDVRETAVKALCAIGSSAAISACLKSLGDPADWLNVNASVLGRIGSDTVISGLHKLTEDTNSRVRESVAEALGETGSEKAIPSLLKLMDDSDSRVRRSAAEALGKIGSNLAIVALLQLLEDANPNVRKSAAKGLRKVLLDNIKAETTIATLIKLAKHHDFNMRWRVAEVLGEIGSDTAILSLLQLVEDTHLAGDTYHYVRKAAAKALGKIGSDFAIPNLLKLLEDADSGVRASATEALGKIGSDFAIPGLLKLVRDSDSEVRNNVAWALGEIGSDTAIPDLIKLVEDSDIDVRWKASEALGKIGSDKAVPGLLKLTKHDSSDVCESAAEALGEIGSDTAIPGLTQLLVNSNAKVFWSAVEALGKIGSDKIIPDLIPTLSVVLIELMEDPNTDVRKKAAETLSEFAKKHTEVVARHISHLLTLIRTDSDKEIYHIVLTTQETCKYYNYEIFQAHLAAQKADRQTHPNSDPNAITIQTLESLTIMTDKAPIFNQQHATIGVNYAAEGSKIEFTQHTSSSEQTFEILLTEYEQFIEQLQQKYTTLADPTTVPQIIEVEAKLLEAQDQQRWQNFLDLKRLWNGGKKAAIKVGEHFAENNVWAKGAIAFLEGVSEDGK